MVRYQDGGAASAIDERGYRSLAEFRAQIRRYLRFSEEAARRAGVEPAQYQLMLAVKGAPGGRATTISYIGEVLQVRHHSAVELVNRTEARGLVERFREGPDRRLVFVRLTTAGDGLLGALAAHHMAELQTVGPVLVRALETIIEERG